MKEKQAERSIDKVNNLKTNHWLQMSHMRLAENKYSKESGGGRWHKIIHS